MKPIQRSQSFSHRAAVALSLTILTTAAHGDAKFDFVNNGPLDGAGIGGSMTVLDPDESTNVTITTVEIVGQDGSLASAPTNNSTWHTSSDAIGVNSDNNVNGNGNDARDFDPGEQWVFTFNVDVNLVEIDFSGWTDEESEFTLSFSDATADIVLFGTESGDTYSLGNTPIAAGVEVTMEVTNATGDNQVRVPFLTVAAVPGAATGDNLTWTGSDGDAWNTTDPNFTGDDTVFAAGDNVTINTAGAINIDAGGITAGSVIDATVSGTVTLQNGNLTTSSLTKSGAGDLVLASPITLDASGGVTTVSGGILQVSNGASLSTTSVALSGGSTVQVDAGGALNVSGTGTIDTGGVTIDIEEPISLGSLSSAVDEVPFIKTGSATLTLTSQLGVQTSGPVDLDILGGSVIATGNNQINLGGANELNGDLTLDGAKIEFHGSTVTGTGSIIAQSGSASIDSRFQGGMTTIANGIVLNSDIIVEAPTNGGSNSELHLNGAITGTGNVEKEGNGLVIFAAANTYTGTTTVERGRLQVGGGLESTSGTLGTGNVTLNIGSTTGTLEFSRNDAHVVPNLISGAGDVIVNNGTMGSTALTAANDYTGVTQIDGGTLIASTLDDGGFPSSIGASTNGAANLLLRGQGILSYTGPAVLTDREFSIGGVVNGSATGGGTISNDGTGPITFDSTADVGADGTGSAERVLTLSGGAPGVSEIALRITDGQASVHSLVKSGTTTWLLTGANTYTGDTTVNEGTLQLGATTDLTNASIVRINGATSILQLTDGVTDVVEELWIDGVQMAAGLHGSSTSSAPVENQDDVHFSGTGVLSVTTGPANDYDTWATSFGLVEGPTGDDDGDSVSNEDEYAFGLDPSSGSSVNPITSPFDASAGTFSYTRRNPSVFSTGLGYTYEWSTTLAGGSWTPFTSDPIETSDSGDPVETITVTVPAAVLAGKTKLFVRVIAE